MGSHQATPDDSIPVLVHHNQPDTRTSEQPEGRLKATAGYEDSIMSIADCLSASMSYGASTCMVLGELIVRQLPVLVDSYW